MAKAYLYSLTDTWDSAGTTFNAIKMNVTDTASAAASLLMDLQVGGSSKFSVRKDGRLDTTGDAVFGGNLYLTVGSALQLGAGDTILARDAANTLAQRNGVNAQTFRLYNTYTDASNYERLGARWSSNTILIGVETAGTGVNRSMSIDAFNVNILTQGSGRWKWDQNGHFITNADNTYDIGASGANRPRNVYVGSSVFAARFYPGNTSVMRTPSGDGTLLMQNSAETDFSRLQFGGTTNAFPALKRSGAEMHVRLADDSAFAKLISAEISSTASLKAHVNTAIPAGGTAGAGVVVSSTSNFGVFFGSGAPTLSAAKGSIYLRSDGTTTNDRMYVNTDGATTWTAVTTAA